MRRLRSELLCLYRATSIALLFLLPTATLALPPERTTHVVIRGHPLTVRLYGTPGRGAPIVVSSGDGGWVHLAPHVAEFLASKDLYVVGVDAKEYLETFTAGTTGVRVQDEPGDYRVLAEFAGRGSSLKPVLIGVAIGLAAAFAASRAMVSLLFGISAADEATFIGAALILGAVALLACYVPAHRAGKVHPASALRCE